MTLDVITDITREASSSMKLRRYICYSENVFLNNSIRSALYCLFSLISEIVEN